MAEAVDHSPLFRRLQAAIEDANFARIAHASDEILVQIAADEDALSCKLVALVNQSAYEEAIEMIDKVPQLNTKLFEKAFCLFKLRKMDEALDALSGAEDSVHVRELRAQLLYRMERFDEALDLYAGLLTSEDDEFPGEHITNKLAALAGSLTIQSVPPAMELPAGSDSYDMFEQTYNTTCILLALGRFKEALKFAEKSIEQCREMLQDEADVTEDEVEDELALLRVQHGVILMSLGKSNDAMNQFTHVLKRKPDDVAVAALASINIIALNKEHGIFDSRKKLAALNVEGLDKKLTSVQRRSIGVNHALLLMHMNQNEACRKKVDELKAEFPESDLPGLIRAYSLRKKPEQSLQCLQDYAAENPTSSERVKLTMAQMSMDIGVLDRAIDILKSIPSLAHQPGIVGLLVMLYTKLENVSAACHIFDDAIAHWKNNASGSSNALQIRKAAASYKYDRNMYAEAGKLYQEILEVEPQDGEALARLITCLAEHDLGEAERFGEQLPVLEFDGEPVDVDALEKQTTRKSVRKVVVEADGTTVVSAAGAAKPGTEGADNAVEPARPKRKRKKRPGKLPKDYNPNIPPDPERWLARWDRTEFKKKHRKKAGLHYQVGRGTQGSATGAAAQAAVAALDASAKPTPKSPVKTPSDTNAAEPPSPSKPEKAPVSNQQQKSKKKKTKKKK